MQRAPHPPKGFIPSEGWASGSQGHPWSPTDTPAAGRRPIAGLPRPPTAPPSASAGAHRPLRGHRRPPPQRRTALPNALGGRRRRGGRGPGTGPGCAVIGSPPPPARSTPRGSPCPEHAQRRPRRPAERGRGRGAGTREGRGGRAGGRHWGQAGEGAPAGEGAKQDKNEERNVRERSRGAELK